MLNAKKRGSTAVALARPVLVAVAALLFATGVCCAGLDPSALHVGVAWSEPLSEPVFRPGDEVELFALVENTCSEGKDFNVTSFLMSETYIGMATVTTLSLEAGEMYKLTIHSFSVSDDTEPGDYNYVVQLSSGSDFVGGEVSFKVSGTALRSNHIYYKVCADQACLEEKAVFDLAQNSTAYLRAFEAGGLNLSGNVSLDGGPEQALNFLDLVTASIPLSAPGDYQIEVTASREGYLDDTSFLEFKVVDEIPEPVDLTHVCNPPNGACGPGETYQNCPEDCGALSVSSCFDPLLDPIPVCTCEDLQNMNGYLSSNFKLQNDIDCSATNPNAPGFDSEGIWGDGQGFEPIGTYDASHPEYRFTGSFDGGNHTIAGLYINRGTKYNGLFGWAASSAVIENLGLVAVDVTGYGYSGGLLAYNKGGTVSNCFVTGRITGIDYANSVGGLVGRNQGGTISDSFAEGSVSVAPNYGHYVGGLVGYTSQDSAIIDCYAAVDVSAAGRLGGLVGLNWGNISGSFALGNVAGSGNNVGGLVGENSAAISNSYASGNVSGEDFVGGLVGTQAHGSISNSYAAGNVSGSRYVGGLAGEGYECPITNSFAAGEVNSVSNSGGFVGFDYRGTYTNNWYYNARNNSQPLGVTKDPVGKASFHTRTHAVYNGSPFWDFDGVWWENPETYPTLQNLEAILPLSRCMVLSQPGRTYCLAESIENNELSGPCFEITAPDITLDCQGNSITGIGNVAGIYSNSENTTIKNCIVSVGTEGGSGSNAKGIFLEGAHGSQVLNNVLNGILDIGDPWAHSNGQWFGLHLKGTNNAVVKENITNSNIMQGIWLENSANCELQGNGASFNGYTGILISESSTYNVFTLNLAVGNNFDGIEIVNSNNVVLNENLACDNSLSGNQTYKDFKCNYLTVGCQGPGNMFGTVQECGDGWPQPGFFDSCLVGTSLFAEQYGSVGCASPNWCNGSDLDNDGDVDVFDLQMFLASGSGGPGPGPIGEGDFIISSFVLSPSSVSSPGSFDVLLSVHNLSEEAGSATVDVSVFSLDGSEKAFFSTSASIASGSSHNFVVPVSVPSSWEKGNYKVRVSVSSQGAEQAQATKFLSVSSETTHPIFSVPELGILLLPILMLVVLFLLYKKGKA